MLTDTQGGTLESGGFPRLHWRQIWSTNPLKRVNKKIKRRTDVVCVCLAPPPQLPFPTHTEAAVLDGGAFLPESVAFEVRFAVALRGWDSGDGQVARC